MIAGDRRQRDPQPVQPIQYGIKQPHSLHRRDRAVKNIPREQYGIRPDLFHRGEKHPIQKVFLILQKRPAIEHPAQVPVRCVQKGNHAAPLFPATQQAVFLGLDELAAFHAGFLALGTFFTGKSMGITLRNSEIWCSLTT